MSTLRCNLGVDMKNNLQIKRDEVACQITKIRIRNANGFFTDGVQAVCSKCGQMSDSYGTGEKSIKRCLAVLHDTCLNNEDNFYIVEKE